MRNAVTRDLTGSVLKYGSCDFSLELQQGETQVSIAIDAALPEGVPKAYTKVVNNYFVEMTQNEKDYVDQVTYTFDDNYVISVYDSKKRLVSYTEYANKDEEGVYFEKVKEKIFTYNSQYLLTEIERYFDRLGNMKYEKSWEYLSEKESGQIKLKKEKA